ncbi:amidohydrolase [Acrocarpospora phusangensis]|uniref:Amidohydrolase n=1 Tax=Acrocarpospora phusangensis TaxID=1070424 RepID=A0A919UJQ8_9ACTN|nr:amidohydrolase [Acrocarpospora phusangensis]GIH24121.1 amidohydrolase [Acrocarpospora phusangensis]
MRSRLPDQVAEALLAPLVDQHCHGVRRDDLVRSAFETLITESGAPAPPGTTHFDSPLGLAVRRWCAPLLDLEPHAPPAVYLARRAELGAEEANRRLLRAAGVVAFLMDGGGDGDLLSPAETGRLGGAAADEVVRLERVEEEVAAEGLVSLDYLDRLQREVEERASRCVGLSSVVAYRYGLDFEAGRPSRGAVLAAAGRRLADPKRPLGDPVLLRHLLWLAADVARERALPIQFPCGDGGARPSAPHRGDPARMAGFIRALLPLSVPVILLDCYPYHRQAARLAAAFPHVYAGEARPAALTESLELAPFHKLLFGSGGAGVAETIYLGALNHRRALGRLLAERLAEDEWSAADAVRVAQMIGSGNARRIYRL